MIQVSLVLSIFVTASAWGFSVPAPKPPPRWQPAALAKLRRPDGSDPLKRQLADALLASAENEVQRAYVLRELLDDSITPVVRRHALVRYREGSHELREWSRPQLWREEDNEAAYRLRHRDFEAFLVWILQAPHADEIAYRRRVAFDVLLERDDVDEAVLEALVRASPSDFAMPDSLEAGTEQDWYEEILLVAGQAAETESVRVAVVRRLRQLNPEYQALTAKHFLREELQLSHWLVQESLVGIDLPEADIRRAIAALVRDACRPQAVCRLRLWDAQK